MKPTFRIVADGADITALINDRLLLLHTLDKPGMESDEFELRIDDRDGAVTLPKKRAGIEIYSAATARHIHAWDVIRSATLRSLARPTRW